MRSDVKSNGRLNFPRLVQVINYSPFSVNVSTWTPEICTANISKKEFEVTARRPGERPTGNKALSLSLWKYQSWNTARSFSLEIDSELFRFTAGLRRKLTNVLESKKDIFVTWKYGGYTRPFILGENVIR